MAIPLEHMGDGSMADRNFQALMSLVLDTGGLSVGVRFGTETATWAASRLSAVKTVTHGLGRVPIIAFAFGMQSGGGHVAAYDSRTLTSTTFDTHGDWTDGTVVTGSFTFGWIVIG